MTNSERSRKAPLLRSLRNSISANTDVDQGPKPTPVGKEVRRVSAVISTLGMAVARPLQRIGSGLVPSADVAAFGRGGGLLFKSFLLFVLAPTVATFIYFAFIASGVFVSEAKLTVRDAIQPAGVEKTGSSILGQLSIGRSGDSAQNSMIVMDYIKSRSVIEDVGGREKLLQLYGRADIDVLSRLAADENLEQMWQYWKSRVTASVDSMSGILTLRVRAYSPNESFSLASDIIQRSESLINAISLRSKNDAVMRAKQEVDFASRTLAEARSEMLKFQQSNQTIDPVETAKQTLKLISELTLQKTALENELATSASMRLANKPGEIQIRARLSAVEAQLQKLNTMLTGHGAAGTVSSQLRDFELLTIQSEFSEYMYKLARSGYERVRQKLEQQDLYLVTVVRPSKPDSASYPRTLPYTALAFAGFLIAWGILSLFIASVKDSIS
ncbi:hypothetical protein PWG15_24620 (plasmid) [Ensifer adhaerens]|uniref:hypothetical protein n=1 Tax=Ensifer adhaerens TaxID=106592 RepID=UPI0023A9E60C|nr:hypothetical protein [Ensifer adhaerens]WDZ80939.1 hypothetical protein PWG15_24620 [Ensifer adhaerens]